MVRELATEEIGWLSLALCILKPCTIEQAFQVIAPDPNITYKDLYQQQTEEMYRLKTQGMNNKEIGEIFGIDSSTVSTRLRRYERQNFLSSKGGFREG